MIKRVLFWVSLTLLIFGCTDKENQIGITQSELHPIAGQINSLTDEFSFRDEVSVNGENYKLLVSNTQEIESQALVSFAYLPDKVEYINNATLTLYSDLKPYGEMEFKLMRLEQDYLESQANWDQASEGVVWEDSLKFISDTPSVTYIDTIATTIDSLVFDLSEEEILTWTQNDLSLLSFIIYTESDNYIEIYSSEHSRNPTLKFNYKLISDASELEDREYDRSAFKDTYIVNDKEGADQTWANTLEISNMLPIKTYFKFDVDPTDLVNQEGQELTDFQKDHLTVNNAYVRFYINKAESSFFGATRAISLTPYRVKIDVTEAAIIDNDNLEYLINTGTSVATIVADPDSTQYIDVKITPILQGIISGEKENYGIVLRSTNQSRNFDSIKLYGKDEADENLRPKVKFVYTLPMED
ncbi:hypothetical protein JEZ13_12015 [bacterium]|nr:hypothetical protein [bacterium]